MYLVQYVQYRMYSVLAPYTQVPQNQSVLRTAYLVPSMHSHHDRDHSKQGRANVNQGRVRATPRRKIDRSVERHVLASSLQLSASGHGTNPSSASNGKTKKKAKERKPVTGYSVGPGA
jgi:hypothetical protein